MVLPPQLLQRFADVGPVKERDSIVPAAPAVVVVLVVECRFEVSGCFDDEGGDGDPVRARRPLGLPLGRLVAGGIAVFVPNGPEAIAGVERELFLQFAHRGLLGVLIWLERTGGRMPVRPGWSSVESEKLVAAAATDEHLDF